MPEISNARIGIIGLGYVGLPLAVAFAGHFPTVGYDLSQRRIDELKAGHDSTAEIAPEALKAAGRLTLSADPQALEGCNTYIVTVPTPIDGYKRPDLTPLLSASELLGRLVRPGDVVIYESTVYPGATEEDCLPVIERLSGLTYNTDFAQGEVDDQQVNLDRFNLFFPEKRPFFLENAGLFSVGQPGQLELFFSRRIGIGASGEQVPILGGGRLSGKLGRNTNIGVLNMQTASVAAGGVPSNNVTVARVRQDFRNRSNLGAMVVNRRATGGLAGADDLNRSYAVDGRWGFGDTVMLSGFAAGTDTPGVRGDAHAYNVAASYESQRYRYGGGFTEVGPAFNPEVGFYARRGYRRVDGAFRTAFRPENSVGFHEWSPHASFFTVRNFDTGQTESEWIHLDNTMEWRNGFWMSTALNVTSEGVLEPFEIFPGVIVPVDRYDHTEAQLRFRTDQGAPLSVEFFSVFGGFFGGRRTQLSPRLSLRVGETFNTQVSWERNDLDLPGGAFVTNLVRLRVNYSFTTRMFVQALVQYNDRARLWSSNLRFGMLSDANTGLFIVYNEIEGIDRFIPPGAGRSLTLKYSYLFDLLN